MSDNISYINFFPYRTYRSEQQEIIREMELDVRLKKNIILIAPSGTGKTIIALSSVLPLVYEKNLKIIYLCRTHTQSARVINELKKISNSNLLIRGISIRGRAEMCLNESLLNNNYTPMDAMVVCNDLRLHESCEYISDFKKIRNFDDNFYLNEPRDAEELIAYCRARYYCPYYFCKHVLNKINILVCNFQWMFNPDIRCQILSLLNISLEDCILIIDECHNVVNMATKVKSDKLFLPFLVSCYEDMKSNEKFKPYTRFIKFLINHLKKKSEEYFDTSSIELDPLNFLKKISDTMKMNPIGEIEKISFIFRHLPFKERIEFNKLIIFSKFWQNWIEKAILGRYFFCYHINKKKLTEVVSLEIIALEPREVTLPLFKNTFSCVNLSGTVNPLIYKNLTALDRKYSGYKEIIANTPFSSKNIKAFIVEGVNTKLKMRTTSMYKKMIQKIKEVVSSTPANSAVFCASYEILNDLIKNGFEKAIKKCEKKVFIEEPKVSGSENAKLLQKYKECTLSEKGAVLLGVCGGRNSEGEDFPGDYMNSVIIAGVPYHLLTPQVNARIKYYNKMFRNQGWLFGYLYPAMQRANQAAGRPIRKEKDKGAIIFLDSRFKSKMKWISYWIRKEIEMIPDEIDAISKRLRKFWL
ncbi:MAG: helicase C-terminal domain-containing protein [Promethearchaeota archaeon]